MVIGVNAQYSDGLLSDIIMLSLCYYHRGTPLNAIKRFCVRSRPSGLLIVGNLHTC